MERPMAHACCVSLSRRTVPHRAPLLAAMLLCGLAPGAASGPPDAPLLPQGEPVADARALIAALPASSPVLRLAYRPDGRLLASADRDGAIRIWDLASGLAIRTLERPANGLDQLAFGLAFAPDGRTLVRVVSDGTVLFWNPETGTALRTLKIKDCCEWQAALSPDGKTLASTGKARDGSLRLWDLASGTLVKALTGVGPDVDSLSFGAGGRMLIGESRDGHTQLWDTASWTPVEMPGGPGTGPSPIAASPDGRMLAGAINDESNGSRLQLWDRTGRTQVRTLESDGSAQASPAFSPDGRTLATAWNRSNARLDPTGGRVRLWDTASGAQLKTLQIPDTQVEAIAFDPHGRTLAVGSGNGWLQIWDPASGRPVRTLQVPAAAAFALVFAADGRTLAGGSSDGTVRLWDLASHRPSATLDGDGEPIVALALAAHGQTLIGGSHSGNVLIYDLAGHQPTARAHGCWGSTSTLAISPDGRTLAYPLRTYPLTHVVQLCDTTNRQPSEKLSGGSSEIDSLAFSPNGQTLAGGSRDKTVLLWDLPDAAKSRGPDGERADAAPRSPGRKAEPRVLDARGRTFGWIWFSPDGAKLWGGSADGLVLRWDARHGTRAETAECFDAPAQPEADATAPPRDSERCFAHAAPPTRSSGAISGWRGPDRIMAIAASPDGKTVAFGLGGNRVLLRDPAPGTAQRTLSWQGGGILSLAFAPDGRTLAGALSDGTVWIRDLASGQASGLLRSVGELWIGCSLAETGDRCWRYDDGTLPLTPDAQGRYRPLPLPARAGPPSLEVVTDRGGAPLPTDAGERVRWVRLSAQDRSPGFGLSRPLQLSDGQAAELPIRVRNSGSEPVYWLRLAARDADPAAPLLLLPPPRVARLAPGAEVTLIARLSYAPPFDSPAPAGTLDLALEMDQGEPIALRVPVLGLVPDPRVVSGPTLIADRRVLVLRLANRGGRDLVQAPASARLRTAAGGAGRTLARVELTRLAAGGESTLAFALPDEARPAAGDRLTLEIQDRASPEHRWRLADLPVTVDNGTRSRAPQETGQ